MYIYIKIELSSVLYIKLCYPNPGSIQSLQKAAIKVIILNAEQLLLAVCLLRLHSEIVARHTPGQ